MHTTKLIRSKQHKHTKKRKSIAEHRITLKISNHKLTKTINDLNKEITNKLHDKLFLEANKKIENGENNNDAADIYLYLHKNKYNPDNIGKWLLHNSPDYKIRKYYFNHGCGTYSWYNNCNLLQVSNCWCCGLLLFFRIHSQRSKFNRLHHNRKIGTC